MAAAKELIRDPINGETFVYRRAEDSFILYSKGINKIDEGGHRDIKRESRTGRDDILIWPRRLDEEEEDE